MGKLTGRTAISTNIDENLLIHVVDTTGTPASYKATLSQLYGVFPKNSSAGASDVNYLARWTAADELGKGIVQDNGSQATINGKTIIKNSGVTSQLEFHKTGSSVIYFYDDAGSAIQSYLGPNTISTTADTFRIYHQGAVAVDINSSQNVDIKETIQIRQTSGTTPGVGQYLKCTDTDGNAEWADVTAGVTATSGSATQVAVFDGTDSIVGDANFTWDGSKLDVPKIGINTTGASERLEVKGAYGLSKFKFDTPSQNNILLEGTNPSYINYYSVASTTANARLEMGIIGSTASFPAVGAGDDTFILSTSEADNLNIINNAGTGTTDNIGFYAGKGSGDLSATTPDLIILGSGSNKGFVGIGTDSPSDELHIKGSGTIVKIETTSTTGNNLITFHDSVGQKGYIGYASGSTENLTILNDETGELSFYTTDSGNNTTKALTISADQDVTVNNGNLIAEGQAYSTIASTVTPSALSATIDWNNGNMQVLDLQTGGSINTLTINNPKAGASYFIKIIQGGGNTITWPAAVKWAENDTYVGSPGAGDIDAVALTYDGTNYLANYSLDYQ